MSPPAMRGMLHAYGRKVSSNIVSFSSFQILMYFIKAIGISFIGGLTATLAFYFGYVQPRHNKYEEFFKWALHLLIFMLTYMLECWVCPSGATIRTLACARSAPRTRSTCTRAPMSWPNCTRRRASPSIPLRRLEVSLSVDVYSLVFS